MLWWTVWTRYLQADTINKYFKLNLHIWAPNGIICITECINVSNPLQLIHTYVILVEDMHLFPCTHWTQLFNVTENRTRLDFFFKLFMCIFMCMCPPNAFLMPCPMPVLLLQEGKSSCAWVYMSNWMMKTYISSVFLHFPVGSFWWVCAQ